MKNIGLQVYLGQVRLWNNLGPLPCLFEHFPSSAWLQLKTNFFVFVQTFLSWFAIFRAESIYSLYWEKGLETIWKCRSITFRILTLRNRSSRGNVLTSFLKKQERSISMSWCARYIKIKKNHFLFLLLLWLSKEVKGFGVCSFQNVFPLASLPASERAQGGI